MIDTIGEVWDKTLIAALKANSDDLFDAFERARAVMSIGYNIDVEMTADGVKFSQALPEKEK